ATRAEPFKTRRRRAHRSYERPSVKGRRSSGPVIQPLDQLNHAAISFSSSWKERLGDLCVLVIVASSLSLIIAIPLLAKFARAARMCLSNSGTIKTNRPAAFSRIMAWGEMTLSALRFRADCDAIKIAFGDSPLFRSTCNLGAPPAFESKQAAISPPF